MFFEANVLGTNILWSLCPSLELMSWELIYWGADILVCLCLWKLMSWELISWGANILGMCHVHLSSRENLSMYQKIENVSYYYSPRTKTLAYGDNCVL